MSTINIALLSIEDDLHALAVQKGLESYKNVSCHIVETDRICDHSNLSWSSVAQSEFRGTLSTRNGDLIHVSELDAIWWRRAYHRQTLPPYIVDPIYIDLINNDCGTSLLGLLLNEFSGTWISDPTVTRLAENKLVQLQAAQRAGFRVPHTLVSQNPVAIRQFCAALDNKVVVKPVKGSLEVPLYTKMLNEEHLSSDESLRLCPAMYQEYIPGDQHIRVHCFGKTVHAVLIESKQLDWRQNLDIPFGTFELNEGVKLQLQNVLRILGLKMGVFDLKLTQGAEPIWIEINPQGQFLFAEGLSGLDLTSAFVEFLYHEAKQASERKL
jgi:glutathione synthase/RimK-type ligase-like ATP-grasp enzyme